MDTIYRFLKIEAKVRYKEDSCLNNKEDIEGNMPFLKGNLWSPMIDIKNGCIINWKKGNTAKIHYKVCDEGKYFLLDKYRNVIKKCNSIPDVLSVNDNGYGDYIIFDIDENGFIKDWRKNEPCHC